MGRDFDNIVGLKEGLSSGVQRSRRSRALLDCGASGAWESLTVITQVLKYSNPTSQRDRKYWTLYWLWVYDPRAKSWPSTSWAFQKS